MKKIFYEKIGRRYVPVSEYDSEWVDSFTVGSHLVTVTPNVRSVVCNVNPNYAAMIAAGKIAQDAISESLRKHSDLRLRPRETPLTEGQKAAWDKLVEELGNDARYLEWPSAREVAINAVEAMQQEADKLMENPSVKKAYEHFMLVCELTKDETNEPKS